MEVLELKNTITVILKLIDRPNGRMEVTGRRVSDYEDGSIEILQSK